MLFIFLWDYFIYLWDLTHCSIFFRLIKLNEKSTLQWKVLSSHNDESSHPDVFCSVKKVFLETSQNSHGNTCARPSLFRGWGLQLYKKETRAQVFFCEFSEIAENTFSRTPPVAASVMRCTDWAKTVWYDKHLFLSLFEYFWQVISDLTPRGAAI